MIRFITIIIFSGLVFAQLEWYNHPELEWQIIETEHFLIYFHKETERSAKEAAIVSETVYENITDLYNFKPDTKTRIIIKDVDDYSNGSAYFYDNKIIIWAKPLDYDLRGSHRWIQDVITHEFTHIIQLGVSMKYPRNIPGSYFQILSYEEEKRADVLYGYPNQIVSYPIPGTAVPPWFAEGTAQYMFKGANYDYWDSIRDMILRDRVINDNLLSFDEMNTFGKKGIGNESIYNQGYSLVNYIAKEFGDVSIKEISQELSKPFIYSIDKAIKSVIGISSYDLYDQWKNELQIIYNKQMRDIQKDKNYYIIENEGTTNIHPIWSPDGKNIAYLSNKDNDFFSQTDLFIYNVSDSTRKKIKGGVKTAPSWISDSLIVYSKISKPNKNGSKFFDLYTYDLTDKKEQRLTEGLRLYSPVFNKKLQKIYAIETYDGTSNILEGDVDFKDYKKITSFVDGTQIYSLSVTDSLIVFDAVKNHDRKIYSIDRISNTIHLITDDKWDSRDPIVNGNQMVYSDDKYGIFNLYQINNQEYITNVTGGAFMPDISKDGKIVFSLYDQGRYKLSIINSTDNIDQQFIGYSDYTNSRSDFSQYSDNDSEQYYYRPTSNKIQYLQSNTNENTFKTKPYTTDMSGPFFLPRITYDYNTVKPGIYIFDNDFINKLSVLGGFSYNKDKDLDFFLLFDNNQYKSSYFFNFYWISRNISRTHPYINSLGQVIPSINFNVDYSYQLFSTDIGNRFILQDHKFWLKYTYSKYRQFYNVKEIQEYEFNGTNTDIIFGKGAYDYFRGHSITFEYEYEGRKPHYLYNMIPKSGFKINTSLAYEKNSLFEDFKVNEDFGGFIENLKSHDTWRYKIEMSNHWKLNFIDRITEKFILTNNIKYFHLSNDNADDFLYFFGGGLPGIKGYTFYEPILQGPKQVIFSNTLSLPIIVEKAIKIGPIYLNSLSIGLSHQIGKSFNGKIIVNNIGYDLLVIENDDFLSSIFLDTPVVDGMNQYSNIKEYLDLNPSLDGLDNNDIIPEELESYLYPDIYAKYDDNNYIEEGKSIKNLRERYNAYKQSIGLQFKLLGFSFYSYPTALTYEYYIPISDSWNTTGKQYLKILFDFN